MFEAGYPPTATGTSARRFTRRRTLQGLAALLCTVGVSRWAQTAAPVKSAHFFSADELTFMDVLADSLIPATDTPGAKEAGVAASFDALMLGWASTRRRTTIRQTTVRLRRNLDARIGQSFVRATPAQRHAALVAIDADAYGAQAARYKDYRAIKVLLVRLYYATQAGATIELRYDPVPGLYDGNVPLAEIGRAWAPVELGNP